MIAERYGWLKEEPVRPPLVLSRWDGFSNIMLFEIPSGALLWWMFDQSDEGSLGVFVHLTSDEAQAVYDSRDVGVLEPVRKQLKDRWAVAWSMPPGGRPRAAGFYVSSTGSEERFSEVLWAAAEATQDDVSLAEPAERAYELAELAVC